MINGLEFTYMWAIYAIPILLIINYILFKLNFVPLNKFDPEFKRKSGSRSKYRSFMIIWRSLMIVIIMFAISSPFIQQEETIETDPFLKIIMDESSSMQVWSQGKLSDLVQELSSKIDVKVSTINDGFGLGNALTANAGENEHILFITDGWDIESGLIDAFGFTQSLNSSVHTVLLGNEKKDAAVSILGPSNVISGINNDFQVQVRSQESVTVKVTVDDVEKYNGIIEETYKLPLAFDSGTHIIKAQVMTDNLVEENDLFVKTVRVIDKPKISYVAAAPDSPFHNSLKAKYDVSFSRTVPSNLSSFHTLILHDRSAININNVPEIERYLVDGGGLIVLGGMNSFDRGNYRGSDIERLLPVVVSSAERKRSPSNIVAIIDLTASVKDFRLANEKLSLLDLQKSVLYNFLNNTAGYHNVALIGFAKSPVMVSDLSPLIEKKGKLLGDVTKLNTLEGTASIGPALRMAKQLFINQNGDKNIILITDGQQYNDAARLDSLKAATDLGRSGIKVNVIKTGTLTFDVLKDWAKRTGNTNVFDDDQLRDIVAEKRPIFERSMRSIADITNGNFFPLEKKDKLNALFSDPEEESYVPKQIASLVDYSHFISRDLELEAKLPGFNNVVAKPSSRLIATMDTGEPVIVSGRYGLGRTATVTGFNPPNSLGSLLAGENSKVMGRVINYGIGDPNRMQDFYVDVSDGFVGIPNTVTVRSDKLPVSEDFRFVKIKNGVYEASFEQDIPGIYSVLDVPYAMNYDIELLEMGKNDDFYAQINLFNGKIFDQDSDKIVEFMKTVSTKKEIITIFLFRYLAMAAIVLYLIEIFARRYLARGK